MSDHGGEGHVEVAPTLVAHQVRRPPDRRIRSRWREGAWKARRAQLNHEEGEMSVRSNSLRLSLLVIFSWSTAYPEENRAWQGVGSTSCAKYGGLDRAEAEDLELMYYVWAQGFMSGLNTAYLHDKRAYRNLAATSVERQKINLSNYCSRNPTHTYAESVLNLYMTLPEESVAPIKK